METLEKEIPIGTIEQLLQRSDCKVEVDSPDGWVEVSDFVDKGMWDEYVLKCNDKVIRCNENHLFETTIGWHSAKEILYYQEKSNHNFSFLCDDGKFHKGEIEKTGKEVPIVDIQVEHDNHRYYTNGVSSHNTGVGKSLAMCHFAAAALSRGKNVLYVTLEMAEKRIAERIDANLFDIAIDKLDSLSKETFDNKVNRISKKTNGKLIIKEYPTASAHAGHFRALLTELKMKKNFKPDIIFIDYLNICASSRIKGLNGDSYGFVKAIAEELRGLAVENDVPIWSATQVNRTGFSSSDPEIVDTSESFGLPATCDFLMAMISTEELEGMNQVMFKQLKNRYNDPGKNKRFTVGIDRSKMRLYNISDPTLNISDNNSSSNNSKSPPVSKTPFGGRSRGSDFENKFTEFKV